MRLQGQATQTAYSGVSMTVPCVAHRLFVACSTTASLLTALAIAVSGCGDQSRTTTDDAPPAATQTSPQASRNDTVEVFLGEYYISMPAVLSPGRTVLRVKNEGFEEHDLQFTRADADSVTWRIEKRLSPGEVRTVTLDLDTGAYAAICDFAGHLGRGMFVDVIVESDSGGRPGKALGGPKMR